MKVILLLLKFFFGTEDADFIKTVSAFISKKRNSKIKNNTYLSNKKIWPIKLAFYKQNSNQSRPDYEITIELDNVGVVHSYKVNYGEFIVRAELKEFKILENTICE